MNVFGDNKLSQLLYTHVLAQKMCCSTIETAVWQAAEPPVVLYSRLSLTTVCLGEETITGKESTRRKGEEIIDDLGCVEKN